MVNFIRQWLEDQSPFEFMIFAGFIIVCIWLLTRFAAPRIQNNHLDRKLTELEEALENRLNTIAYQLDMTFDKNRSATEIAVAGLAERIGRIDAAQANLAALSGQITGLERTLSDKQARGAFGEARLGDLLRDALPASAFKEQATLSNGRRADALLILPHPPGSIAVDSKFPLESYRAILAADNSSAKNSARKSFERDVTKHITDIADRYIVPNETSDCALMFVPSEAVFAELHAYSSSAVEEGYRKRVFIVSPTTIWALLNTIRAIMKDVRMKEESVKLQAEAQALVTDVAAIARAAETVRRRIQLAETDLTSLVDSAKTAERRGARIRDIDLE